MRSLNCTSPWTVSRRQWLGGALSAGAACLTRGVPGLAQSGADQRAYPKGTFVDVHTHVGTIVGDKPPMTAESLLRWMDAHDVAQAWVLPLVSPESFQNPVPVEVTLTQTKPYRDRLIPFCSVDPRNSWVGGGKRLRDQLRRYQDAGARGFGEHKPGVPIDDPASLDIYAACGELSFPVLVHIDNQRNLDKPGLPGLERALKACPQTNFVGHGPGWWASISGDAQQADLGGYPRGPIAPGGAIDTLMDKYSNLYGDLSAGSGSGALQRDLKFAREFFIRRADRLMFGTDYLSDGQVVQQFEVVGSLDLPADVQERVFRGNARRLTA